MIKTLIDFFGFAKEVNTNKFDRKKGDELLETPPHSGIDKETSRLVDLEYDNAKRVQFFGFVCIIAGIIFFFIKDVVPGLICCCIGAVIMRSSEPIARIGENNKSVSGIKKEDEPHEPISTLAVLKDKDKIVDLLLQCQSIQNMGTRQTIVNELPDYIKNCIHERRDSRSHVFEIVTTCSNYPGGFAMFIEQLGSFDGETIAFQELIRFIRNLEI
ncbi:MAG: hypothetical protein D3907_00090 [Candidatus Electrothrix sp. AUS3]|nr:hypothetical protein [Candidatus Electrothrix gigas]